MFDWIVPLVPGLPILAALVEAGHEIACVYTQPPRPAGRGHAPRAAPVQVHAEARGIPVRFRRPWA